jgi:hypothetical protein
MGRIRRAESDGSFAYQGANVVRVLLEQIVDRLRIERLGVVERIGLPTRRRRDTRGEHTQRFVGRPDRHL